MSLELFREAIGPAPETAVLDSIQDVVFVQCSSRGGSSVFMEMLRHSQSFHHLSGEIGPALALAGLTFPHSQTGSDALSAEHATEDARRIIHNALRSDIGNPMLVQALPPGADNLARTLSWRLKAQWPLLGVSEHAIRDAVSYALTDPLKGHDFSTNQRFQAALLQRLRESQSAYNPWYYDLDPNLVRAVFPDVPQAKGPPSSAIIEEPPFVLSGPWRHTPTAELSSRPLILKTPSNAYRMPFLRALFPKARVRVVHLTRNPAASINGLVDGWRFRGFHAHRMTPPLEITGIHPEDREWWKYDLPPGWERWRSASLVQVAAFQWSSAHQSILNTVPTDSRDTLRLRFEDVVGPSRIQAFQTLFDWLGVPLDAPMATVIETGLPPVMATQRPRQRRWFDRAEELGPVLQTDAVVRVARELGYTDPSEWI